MLQRKEVKPTEKELKEIQRKVEVKKLREKEEFEVLSLMMHERTYSKTLGKDIVRVQSGWLYSDWDPENDMPFNTVFVIDTRE